MIRKPFIQAKWAIRKQSPKRLAVKKMAISATATAAPIVINGDHHVTVPKLVNAFNDIVVTWMCTHLFTFVVNLF